MSDEELELNIKNLLEEVSLDSPEGIRKMSANNNAMAALLAEHLKDGSFKLQACNNEEAMWKFLVASNLLVLNSGRLSTNADLLANIKENIKEAGDLPESSRESPAVMMVLDLLDATQQALQSHDALITTMNKVIGHYLRQFDENKS